MFWLACLRSLFRKEQQSSLPDRRLKVLGDKWIKKDKMFLKVRDPGTGSCGKTEFCDLPGLDMPMVLMIFFNPQNPVRNLSSRGSYPEAAGRWWGSSLSLGTYPTAACLFMTYLGQENLDQLLDKHIRGAVHLDGIFFLLVIEEVILKLTDIHAKGVVHVDFNSTNLMTNRSDPRKPKAFVIDFGVSL